MLMKNSSRRIIAIALFLVMMIGVLPADVLAKSDIVYSAPLSSTIIMSNSEESNKDSGPDSNSDPKYSTNLEELNKDFETDDEGNPGNQDTPNPGTDSVGIIEARYNFFDKNGKQINKKDMENEALLLEYIRNIRTNNGTIIQLDRDDTDNNTFIYRTTIDHSASKIYIDSSKSTLSDSEKKYVESHYYIDDLKNKGVKSVIFKEGKDTIYRFNVNVRTKIAPDGTYPDLSNCMHTTMKVKYHMFDKEGNEIGDDTLIKDEKLLDFLASIYCGVYEQGSGKLATTIVNDLTKMTKSQKDKDGYYTFGQANIFYQNYIGKLILGNYRTESGAGGYLEDIYLNTNEFKEINFYYNFDNYIHGVDQTSVEFVPDNKGGGEYVVKYDVNILPRNLNAAAKINVKKNLLDKDGNNALIKKGQFRFNLIDSEGKIIDTKTNDENGNVHFEINYTIEDLGKRYRYIIEEINDNDSKIIYDSHKEEVFVDISKEKDKIGLVANISYDKDGAIFNNKVLHHANVKFIPKIFDHNKKIIDSIVILKNTTKNITYYIKSGSSIDRIVTGKYKIILDNISTYKSQTLSIVPNNEKIKKKNEFAFEIPDNLHDDIEVQFTATKISEPNGYTDEDTANNLFKVNIK